MNEPGSKRRHRVEQYTALFVKKGGKICGGIHLDVEFVLAQKEKR
jgi:hypothetical protein